MGGPAAKVNTDHTLYVNLRTSTVGTATMDTHRTLEKERRDKLIFLETILQNSSLNQLLNIDRTSDRIATEVCGQIDTTID